jgi:hypothetical protein
LQPIHLPDDSLAGGEAVPINEYLDSPEHADREPSPTGPMLPACGSSLRTLACRSRSTLVALVHDCSTDWPRCTPSVAAAM